jgi:hypothetical protein
MPFIGTDSERKQNLGSFVTNLMKQHNAVEMNIVDDNAKIWNAPSPKIKVPASKNLAAPAARRNKSSPQAITAAALSVVLQAVGEQKQIHDVLDHPTKRDAPTATGINLSRDRQTPTLFRSGPRRNVATVCHNT